MSQTLHKTPLSHHTPERRISNRQLARGMLVCLLLLGLNAASLTLSVEHTAAYYADTERSIGNNLAASMLDFTITSSSTEGYVGVEADGDIDDFSSVVKTVTGSLDVQYRVDAEFQDGSKAYCSSLQIWADHKDAPQWQFFPSQDPLTFTRGTTSKLGTYEFKQIGASYDSRRFAHGTRCEMDLVFSGWRNDTDTPTESGYTDTERISLDIKNRMIVMNEFLPNPDPSAGGVNFGNDHDAQPKGEWVELYNNSNKPYDLSGWQIRDAADNTTSVAAANTAPATTTIPARSWLVVYLNGAVLNNTGDTIKLENASGTVIDNVSYDASDNACEQEPTPNATNTGSTSGECDEVPPNKSYARFPDGTGEWIDPAPTPGNFNVNVNDMDLAIAPDIPDVAGVSTTSDATTSDPTASSSDKNTQEKNTSSSTPPTDTDNAHDDTNDGAQNTGDNADGTQNSNATTSTSTASTGTSTDPTNNATSSDDTASSTDATSGTSTDNNASDDGVNASSSDTTADSTTNTGDTLEDGDDDGTNTNTSGETPESEEKTTREEDGDSEDSSDTSQEEGQESDTTNDEKSTDTTSDEENTDNEPDNEQDSGSGEDGSDTTSDDSGSDATDNEDGSETQQSTDDAEPKDEDGATETSDSSGGQQDTETDDTDTTTSSDESSDQQSGDDNEGDSGGANDSSNTDGS